MKKISLSILVCLAVFLTGCDSISPEVANAFVGEYWMETTNTIMLENQIIEENPRTTWSPVSIYEKGGKLFVRTYWYGAPYLRDDEDKQYILNHENPELIPSKRFPASLMDDGDNDEGGGIEVVETDGKTMIVLMNGFVYTVRNGAYLVSEPIPVRSGSSTMLELEKSKSFEVALTTVDGQFAGNALVNHEYGFIVQKEDVISWQIDMTVDAHNTSYKDNMEFDRVVHKNILHKRK